MDLDYLLQNRKVVKEIDNIFLGVYQLDVVTKELRKESIALAGVRTLFHNIAQEYPRTSNRFRAEASIVHIKEFETGIVKILSIDVMSMISYELEAV